MNDKTNLLHPRDQHSKFWQNSHAYFDTVYSTMNLDPLWRPYLASPKRVLAVSCPIKMDDGRIQTFTGYPVSVGGSVGREEATGRGVMNTLRQFLATQSRRIEEVRVAIQGFGNVGYHAARLLHERGAKVIAISERSSGIFDESGIDVE